MNLAVLDGTRGEPATGIVANFRKQLWATHLGPSASSMTESRPNGWLVTWRGAADANVAALRDGGVSGDQFGRSLLLPYVPTARPRDQLRALRSDTRAAGIDLRFDPGTVEVLWSPGWLKKLAPERIRQSVG